tara:strand:+ start:177 stop:443 length:267 start_codon:yes stop_codon:yes gene_type:complete
MKNVLKQRIKTARDVVRYLKYMHGMDWLFLLDDKAEDIVWITSTREPSETEKREINNRNDDCLRFCDLTGSDFAWDALKRISDREHSK